MVFSYGDSVIMKNNIENKGWQAYRIHKEYPLSYRDYSSIGRCFMIQRDWYGKPKKA